MLQTRVTVIIQSAHGVTAFQSDHKHPWAEDSAEGHAAVCERWARSDLHLTPVPLHEVMNIICLNCGWRLFDEKGRCRMCGCEHYGAKADQSAKAG